MARNNSVDYEIVEKYVVLSEQPNGYTKEFNLISWNGAKPKYDIRIWPPNHEYAGKGVTLTDNEAESLLIALHKNLRGE